MVENVKKVAKNRNESPKKVVESIRAIVITDSNRRTDNMLLAALSGKITQCAHKEDFPVASVYL